MTSSDPAVVFLGLTILIIVAWAFFAYWGRKEREYEAVELPALEEWVHRKKPLTYLFLCESTVLLGVYVQVYAQKLYVYAHIQLLPPSMGVSNSSSFK